MNDEQKKAVNQNNLKERSYTRTTARTTDCTSLAEAQSAKRTEA